VPKPTNTAVTTSQIANGLGPAKNETLSDVLNTMDVTASHSAAKIAFLKPRGLVNTGNMCYMNSVCLLFCCCDPPKLIDAGVTNLGLLYSIL
jgi:ubiquitin carboxyl-terminal hydrolase 10